MKRRSNAAVEAEPMTQIALKLPVSTVQRIEAHARRLRAGAPGVLVQRSDAARALLLDALGRAEADKVSGD